MKKGIAYIDLNEAKKALSYWNGTNNSLAHIGNSASSVFSYKDESGKLQILGFTDSSFRSKLQIEGELNFINHLSNSGCAVHELVLTKNGERTLEISAEENLFYVNSFTYAIGEQVETQSKNWNNHFFETWGESLGKLYQCSESYRPQDQQLWQWFEEILFRKIKYLIPPEDDKSEDIIQNTIEQCRSINMSESNY